MTTPTPPNPELAALPDLFLLNPRNRVFLDGKRTFSSKGLRRGRSLLLFAFMILLLSLAGYKWFNYLRLTTAGVATEATITTRGTRDCEGTCYYALYTFAVGSQQYSVQNSIGMSTYRSIQQGSLAEIIYDPDYPNRASLRQELTVPFGDGLLVLTGIGLLLWYAARVMRRRRQDRNLSKGVLLKGEVTAWRSQEFDDEESKGFNGQLDYVFYTSAGLKRGGREVREFSVHAHKQFVPPQPGTPIAVLYVDDDTFQVL